MTNIYFVFIVPVEPACFGCERPETSCSCIDVEGVEVVAECDCSQHADCCAVCGETVDAEFIEMTADHEVVLVDGVYCHDCLRSVETDCHNCDDRGYTFCGPDEVPCGCQPTAAEMRAEHRFEQERDGW